jgi:hypothetical protein
MPRSAGPRLADNAADRVNDVTVRFEHAAVIFLLPDGATLADIASRIAAIETRRLGEPLSIDVKLHH